MIGEMLAVVLRMSAGIAAAAVFALGFAYLIFLGDAHANRKALVSEGFDRFAVLVIYLSWFGPLWWFGPGRLLIMVACGATIVLCLVYAASYRAASSGGSGGATPHADSA